MPDITVETLLYLKGVIETLEARPQWATLSAEARQAVLNAVAAHVIGSVSIGTGSGDPI